MAKQLEAFAPRGQLWFGDNLEVLRRHIDEESVDLIYLDPPFKSNKAYNLLFTHRDGRLPTGQVKAFDDTWSWGMAAAEEYDKVMDEGGDVAKALRAFRGLLGPTDMLSYLTMMAPRLVALERSMKTGGSIYLHCDPTASHYLKLLMDAVFDPTSFQNEIVWHYRGGGVSKTRWGRRHDILLFYTKGTKPKTFNVDPVRTAYSASVLESSPSRYDKSYRGERVYSGYKPNPLGKHPDDVWPLQPLMPSDRRERLGYPTQKPRRLLERVILASSNEGELVLDPFCGCGTTIHEAQALGRRWIGIDVTELAIRVIRERLQKHFGAIDYKLRGEPGTLDEAVALAKLDKHEFQRWVCRRLGIKDKVRRGADRGIDGELMGRFDDGSEWKAIVSVKGGGVTVSHLRDLGGTITREKADMGLLVTLNRSTKPMDREAADAGFGRGGVPRLQIMTVQELLEGKRPIYPEDVRLPGRLRVVGA